MEKIKIYAYLRISRLDLDIENQRIEISNFCLKRFGKIPDEWVEDTVSGKKNAADRNLGGLLKKLKKDSVFVAASTSRVGRSFFDMLETAKIVLDANARFIAIQQNFELTNDFQGKMLFAFYSLMAEREREDISLRTRAGLEKARLKGNIGGRRKGEFTVKLQGKEDEVKRYKEKGLSVTSIAKLCDVTRQTMTKYIESIKEPAQ